MAILGECGYGREDGTTVCECKHILKIEVLSSPAGYYIGFFCPKCGPYSRESGYYSNKIKASEALKSGAFCRA